MKKFFGGVLGVTGMLWTLLCFSALIRFITRLLSFGDTSSQTIINLFVFSGLIAVGLFVTWFGTFLFRGGKRNAAQIKSDFGDNVINQNETNNLYNLNQGQMRRLFFAIEINLILWLVIWGGTRSLPEAGEYTKYAFFIGILLAAVLQHWGYYYLYKPIRKQKKKEREKEQEGDRVICPNCGHYGKPKRKESGNFIIYLFLLCLFVIPGVIYAERYNKVIEVCKKCGHRIRTLNDKQNTKNLMADFVRPE
jgi:hypothetical protein